MEKNEIKVIHDQHVHSEYSLDSNASYEKYYEIASKMGCSYFVTTEHIEFDSVITNGDWTVNYEEIMEKIPLYSEKYHIQGLLGVEIGYRKDHIQDMENLIHKYPFDVVNMSIHDSGKYDYYIKDHYLLLGNDQMMHIYLDNCIDGLQNFTDYDVFSHLDYGFKTIYSIDPSFNFHLYEDKIRTILSLIIQNNKVLEINTKVQSAFKNDEHLIWILKMYYDLGGRKISISSDSHVNENYLLNFNHYKDLVKSLGFSELSYFVQRKEHKFKI